MPDLGCLAYGFGEPWDLAKKRFSFLSVRLDRMVLLHLSAVCRRQIIDRVSGASDFFHVDGHVEGGWHDTLELVDRSIAFFFFGSASNSGLLDDLGFIDGIVPATAKR